MDAEELADIVNPSWALHKKTTPTERFNLVHQQWQSSRIPNPHKDLTTRYQAISWKYNRTIKTDSFNGSARKVNVSCDLFYNEQINKLNKDISNLEREIDNLYRSKKYNKHVYVNNRIAKCMDEKDDLKQQLNQFQKAKKELNHLFSFYDGALKISEYARDQINNQSYVIDNMTKFYKQS